MNKIINKYLKDRYKKFSNVLLILKSIKREKNYKSSRIEVQKIIGDYSSIVKNYYYKFKEIRKFFLKKYLKKIKNYKSSSKQKKQNFIKTSLKIKGINSNNFIFYVYLFAGISISLIVFLLFSTKLIKKNKTLSKSIETSIFKKSQLPTLKKKLSDYKDLEQKYLSDRKFLEKLIGGNNNLKTFLFMLNNLAKKNSVEILEFEPLGIVEYKEIISNTNSSSLNNQTLNDIPISPQPGMPPPSSTPLESNNIGNQISINESDDLLNNESNYLLTNKLEKQIFKIRLKTYFTDLLSFVRDLEKLENVLILDDFKIKRLEDYNKTPKSKIELESTFSIFGRNKNHE